MIRIQQKLHYFSRVNVTVSSVQTFTLRGVSHPVAVSFTSSVWFRQQSVAGITRIDGHSVRPNYHVPCYRLFRISTRALVWKQPQQSNCTRYLEAILLRTNRHWLRALVLGMSKGLCSWNMTFRATKAVILYLLQHATSLGNESLVSLIRSIFRALLTCIKFIKNTNKCTLAYNMDRQTQHFIIKGA